VGPNVNVPSEFVAIRVDSRLSTEVDIGEEATEMGFGVGSDGSVEDIESGDEGHGDGGDGLPGTRVEGIDGSGSASMIIMT